MLTDMQVFNEYIMPATIETLQQQIDKFNEMSAGAIVLTTNGFTGDFLQRSFFASVHSAVRRVDRYAANTTAPVTNLTQLRENGVKVAGGFGPILYEPSQMSWLQKPTGEGIAVASQNFAEAMFADQLNTAIGALVAAITDQADATNDVSGVPAPITQGAMNGAHAKFGDSSSALVAQVMDGTMVHKLIGQAIDNDNRLFNAGSVQVIDILGKRVIVTDAPALHDTVNDKNIVLSLATQAAVVYEGGDVVSNIETSNGNQRIETTMQVDYTFGLALKGHSWDETNGGKSPNDATLQTGTNWPRTSALSVKTTAGVATIGDSTL